jgi:hypothetical protein
MLNLGKLTTCVSLFCTRTMPTPALSYLPWSGTSLSMDIASMSHLLPPSPREKEATAQAMPKRRWLRQVWEKRSEFVTREPSKLAKQSSNHKTVAHIINPGKITWFVHAIDLAWQPHPSASYQMLHAVQIGGDILTSLLVCITLKCNLILLC